MEEDEQPLAYHDEKYYNALLRTLDKPKKKKKRTDDDTSSSSQEPIDSTSPFHYIQSPRAMASLRAKFNADRSAKEHASTGEEMRVRMGETATKVGSSANVKGMLGMVRILQRGGGTLLERTVDRELVDQYRNDPRSLAVLKERCKLIVQKKNEAIAAKAAAVPKLDTAFLELTLDERLETARSRREQIDIDLRERTEASLDRKSNRPTTSKTRTHTDRMKTWISLVIALHGFAKMSNVVLSARAVKFIDKDRWNACLKIQRFWRKLRAPQQCLNILDVIRLSSRMKHAATAEDQQRAKQYKLRVSSADMMLRFLRDTSLRARFNRVIRMVKRIQRAYRTLRRITMERVAMLRALLEACMYPLSFHISIVGNKRGLDMNNLTMFEQSQMKTQGSSSKSYRLLNSMQTPEYHAFLRKNLAKIGDFHKECIVNTRQWNEYADVRNNMLKNLVRRKRKEFLRELHAVEPMQYRMPPISMDEVKAFVSGGEDPLEPRVRELQRRHDLWVAEQKRPKTPYRPNANPSKLVNEDANGKEKPPKKYVQPRLFILSRISAEDLTQVICDYMVHVKDIVTAAQLKERQSLAARVQKLMMEDDHARHSSFSMTIPRSLSSASSDSGGGTSSGHGSPQQRASRPSTRVPMLTPEGGLNRSAYTSLEGSSTGRFSSSSAVGGDEASSGGYQQRSTAPVRSAMALGMDRSQLNSSALNRSGHMPTPSKPTSLARSQRPAAAQPHRKLTT